MIMRVIQQTQHYLCEFRAKLVYDLEEYESGRRRTNVIRNGLRHDDTYDRIAELKLRLAKTDNLIATYQEYKDA
jgi:hypothetical protein